MAVVADLQSTGDELAASLREWREGSLVVQEVSVSIGEDRDGVLAINLTAVLADPGPGLDTWPLEDVLPLRRSLRSEIMHRGLETPVYLWFKPVSDPPQDED